ncbi:MAG: HepT-like ribonuclease domain-containing protein [Flavitalea sp.]
MSSRESSLLIGDIIDSAKKIQEYTAGQTFDEFIKDGKTVDAVIRNFEIIGEAANRLPDDFKDRFPHIEWHLIRGFRNRIVHHYFGIDHSIVWVTINTFLPGMIRQLQSLSNDE